MRIKSFVKKAQIKRTPGTYDLGDGVSEVGPPDPDDFWTGPRPWEQKISPQSDQYANSVSSNLPKGLSEEQFIQVLKRTQSDMSEDDLKKLYEENKQNEIIAPIILAYISDKFIIKYSR